MENVKKKYRIKISEGLYVQRFHRDRFDSTRTKELAGSFRKHIAEQQIKKRHFLKDAQMEEVIKNPD